MPSRFPFPLALLVSENRIKLTLPYLESIHVAQIIYSAVRLG